MQVKPCLMAIWVTLVSHARDIGAWLLGVLTWPSPSRRLGVLAFHSFGLTVSISCIDVTHSVTHSAREARKELKESQQLTLGQQAGFTRHGKVSTVFWGHRHECVSLQIQELVWF